MPNSKGHLLHGFLDSVSRFPQNIALEVGDTTLTYETLARKVASYQNVLLNVSNEQSPYIGLLANRSVTAYTGPLAILSCGRAYLPLSPDHPTERILRTIQNASTRSFIVGLEGIETLLKLLPLLRSPSIFFLPELQDLSSFTSQFPDHIFVGQSALTSVRPEPVAHPGRLAYLLYTSGSTGTPKGIMVSHASVLSYLDSIQKELRYTSDDRVSLTFDLTFDPSVHDMFVTWFSGATLVVLPKADLLFNHQIISEKRLTSWYSVPFQIFILMKARLLNQDAFPLLRRSLFAGEALPNEWVKAWAYAAPNSSIYNLYGPSETTVILSTYKWSADKSLNECQNGYVPIGHIFPSLEHRIVSGELWISGPQLSEGYLNDTELTEAKFPMSEGKRWYRTGDLVEEDESHLLHFKGRVDQQFKIRGLRVEVNEIHEALRSATKAKEVIALPWPATGGSNTAIFAFVVSPEVYFSEIEAKQYCAEELPGYMVPKGIFPIEQLPTNSNGKVDRVKLYKILEERIAACQKELVSPEPQRRSDLLEGAPHR